MSPEEMKQVARRFLIDAWQGDFEALNETVSPEYRLGDMGFEGLKEIIKTLNQAMPDFKVEPKEMIAEGDTVAYSWIMTGTHLHDVEGFPVKAKGKPYKATGITILHLRDGKIISDEFESSSPSPEQQLS